MIKYDGDSLMVQNARPEHQDVNDEMWDKIDKIIEENRDIPGSIITVLRLCQDIVSYLPVELINYISQGMKIPSSEVFGVATFYSLFSMKPKGRNAIKVCKGTACYVRGIKEVIAKIAEVYHLKEDDTTDDRRFSLESVRCLGACGLAPAMVVGADTHGSVSPNNVVDILEKYE